MALCDRSDVSALSGGRGIRPAWVVVAVRAQALGSNTAPCRAPSEMPGVRRQGGSRLREGQGGDHHLGDARRAGVEKGGKSVSELSERMAEVGPLSDRRLLECPFAKRTPHERNGTAPQPHRPRPCASPACSLLIGALPEAMILSGEDHARRND